MKKEQKDDFHFPEEMTTEILSRLPVKSLVRFKCVSKSWRNLILSSQLVTNHFNCNTKRRKRISYISQYSKNQIRSFSNDDDDDDAVTDLHIPFLSKSHDDYSYPYTSVVGSSNGLVCIISHQSSSRFVVWNPANWEFRYLPHPQTLMKYCYFAGFDVITTGGVCDYKLVLVTFIWCPGRSGFDLQVEVFTRSTNSWKQIDDGLVPCLKVGLFSGVVVNGSICWPINNATYGIDSSPSHPKFVACFDIWKERFTRIKGPSCSQHSTNTLGVLNRGSSSQQLAMFFASDLGFGFFDGWAMNAVDQSWTKLFTIDLLSPEFVPLENVGLVGFWLKDEIIVQMDHKMFLYDRHTKELTDFPAQQSCCLFPYEETLFSV